MKIRYNKSNLLPITMFIIVWGHHFSSPLNRYIFSFSVPLLFFNFGLITQFDLSQNWGDFLKDNIKKVIIPYFIYSFCLYLYWLLLFFLKTDNGDISPLSNLWGIFYSQGMRETMDWGLQMWIFPCLFFINIITRFLIKNSFHAFLVLFSALGISIIGTRIPCLFAFHLPWSIDIAMVSTFFFLLGNIFQKRQNPPLSWYWILFISLALIALGFFIERFNVRLDLKNHSYGNLFIFYSSALLSISGFYYLSTLYRADYLRKISWIWIPLYVFHMEVSSIIRFIGAKLGLIDIGIMNTFIYSLLEYGSILFCGIVVFTIVKKQLIDKKNKLLWERR